MLSCRRLRELLSTTPVAETAVEVNGLMAMEQTESFIGDEILVASVFLLYNISAFILQ